MFNYRCRGKEGVCLSFDTQCGGRGVSHFCGLMSERNGCVFLYCGLIRETIVNINRCCSLINYGGITMSFMWLSFSSITSHGM